LGKGPKKNERGEGGIPTTELEGVEPKEKQGRLKGGKEQRRGSTGSNVGTFLKESIKKKGRRKGKQNRAHAIEASRKEGKRQPP